MLAKENRLKKNKEFDLVFKDGKTAYGGFIGIKLRKNELDINRFGVLLSTKVSKLAVTRNSYKRKIKAIIKQEGPQVRTGYDCVVIVLPLILGKKYPDIRTELQTIFRKLKFYS